MDKKITTDLFLNTSNRQTICLNDKEFEGSDSIKSLIHLLEFIGYTKIDEFDDKNYILSNFDKDKLIQAQK